MTDDEERESQFREWLKRSPKDRRMITKGLTFDKTVNLGHILTVLTLIIMFSAFFNRIDTRLTAVETNVAWIVRNIK